MRQQTILVGYRCFMLCNLAWLSPDDKRGEGAGGGGGCGQCD